MSLNNINDFQPFALLVDTAKKMQNNSITQEQYRQLLALYLKSQPKTNPLFGWYYKNRHYLLTAIKDVGITIKSDNYELKTKRTSFKAFCESEKA